MADLLDFTIRRLGVCILIGAGILPITVLNRGSALIIEVRDGGTVIAEDTLLRGFTTEGKSLPSSSFVKVRLCAPAIVCACVGSLKFAYAGRVDNRQLQTDFDFGEMVAHISQGKNAVSPKTVAEQIRAAISEPFKTVDALYHANNLELGDTTETDRFTNFYVVGYPKDGKLPQILNISIKIDRQSRHLEIGEPTQIFPAFNGDGPPFIGTFGIVEHIAAALSEKEPERSMAKGLITSDYARLRGFVQEVPNTFQDTAMSHIGLIRMESKFNPEKVGTTVTLIYLGADGKVVVATIDK